MIRNSNSRKDSVRSTRHPCNSRPLDNVDSRKKYISVLKCISVSFNTDLTICRVLISEYTPGKTRLRIEYISFLFHAYIHSVFPFAGTTLGGSNWCDLSNHCFLFYLSHVPRNCVDTNVFNQCTIYNVTIWPTIYHNGVNALNHTLGSKFNISYYILDCDENTRTYNVIYILVCIYRNFTN